MEQAMNIRTGGRSDRAKSKRDKGEAGKPLETVMHYVRMLNGIPSRALGRSVDATAAPGGDPSAPVAWRCADCGTIVPRSQEPADTCPCCGSMRQGSSLEISTAGGLREEAA